jgi:hypothetical protein
MVLTPNEGRPTDGPPGQAANPGQLNKTDRGQPKKGCVGYAFVILGVVVLILFVAVLAGGFIGSRSERAVATVETMEGQDTASVDRTGALFQVEADSNYVQLEGEGGAPSLIVYFEAGREDAAVNFQSAAGPIQAYAQANPNARFEVVGFEDATAEADTTNPLAERRASNIAEALANLGIDNQRIGIRNAREGARTLRPDDNTGRVEVRTISQ